MTTTTITCPKCGHPMPYAPEHWLDFGNWAGGHPTHIACTRCGEMMPLPGGGRGTPWRIESRPVRIIINTFIIVMIVVIAVAVGTLVVRVLHG